jgi:hypothetical protein
MGHLSILSWKFTSGDLICIRCGGAGIARSEHYLFSDPPEHWVEVVLPPQPLSVAEAVVYSGSQVRTELV